MISEITESELGHCTTLSAEEDSEKEIGLSTRGVATRHSMTTASHLCVLLQGSPKFCNKKRVKQIGNQTMYIPNLNVGIDEAIGLARTLMLHLSRCGLHVAYCWLELEVTTPAGWVFKLCSRCKNPSPILTTHAA